jgi:hypothetical protein
LRLQFIYNKLDKNGSKAVYYNSFEYPSIIKFVNKEKTNFKQLSGEEQEKIQFIVKSFGGWSNIIDTNINNQSEDIEHTLLTVIEDSIHKPIRAFYYYWKNNNGPKSAVPYLVDFFESLFN